MSPNVISGRGQIGANRDEQEGVSKSRGAGAGAEPPAVILRSPALRNDEGSPHYVCPNGADSHSLAMVQRERVFPHECGVAHAPLRVSYRRTSAGISTGVICETRALPGAVIPAKAGIYSASHWKWAADGLDSRFRGNDQCFERDPIPNDTSTQES